ncbi:MAG: hypothetical protein IPL15_24830 [Comamonadaceae bacterium]|uniref:hypothetical protein n=1 Tax=Candidatus Skiveiella danica TaxID=3386177 RepID=UPI00390C2F7E|nr:hypothetical protein [Comamonadaceae bacterium]
MKGDRGIRSLEDMDLAALSYAEVKPLASGRPLVIRKAGVDAEVGALDAVLGVAQPALCQRKEGGRLPMMVEALGKCRCYAGDAPD